MFTARVPDPFTLPRRSEIARVLLWPLDLLAWPNHRRRVAARKLVGHPAASLSYPGSHAIRAQVDEQICACGRGLAVHHGRCLACHDQLLDLRNDESRGDL